MEQTKASDKSTNTLQRQDDQRLMHNNAAFRWLVLNWRMMALVGGLTIAGGSGVVLLLWLANVIDDLGQALNFVAQNTLSLFIFLAVIVQAVISNKQWRAMYDGLERTDKVIDKMQGQLDAMNDQAKLIRRQVELMAASERAYLGLRDWKTPKFEDGFLILEARFWNGGRTPAWGVCGHSRVGVDYEPRPSFPAVPTKDEESLLDAQTSLVIAANDRAVLPFTPLQVTDTQIRLVQQGKMRIFVDGVCRYFDSMGGKQFYTYGFTLNWGDIGVTPRYEYHHRVQANDENPD